jgi:osmotically-inducible protein OsmY
MSNTMNIQSQDADEKLRAVILARFAANDCTAFANLRVGVVNGIVHLAGVVNSIETRVVAAELAEEVQGVRGVVNRIEAPGAPLPSRTVHLSPILKEKTTRNDEIPE